MADNRIKTLAAVPIFLLVFGTANYLLLGKVQFCLLRTFCGLPCPGCGLSHAGIALLMLDWRGSMCYHLLFVPIVLTLATGCIPSGYSRIADFVNRQFWWHTLLLVSSLVYFCVRLFGFERNGDYPMCYDPANYLQLLTDLLRRLW